MDLTHADYLHPTTLGGGSWTQTPGKVTDNGNSLKIHWDSKNNVPFPLIAKALKIGNQPVDSFTEVEWFPASIMTLRTGSAPAGVPMRSEEHTSELTSLMRISYAVFCLK